MKIKKQLFVLAAFCIFGYIIFNSAQTEVIFTADITPTTSNYMPLVIKPGPAVTSTPIGNVLNGEKLFNQSVIGPNSAPGCITCHSLVSGIVLVGPPLSNIGNEAESRLSGFTAEFYLRQSITDPNAFIAPGFTEGVMYQTYGEELSPSDINDIVAFMLTLKQP